MKFFEVMMTRSDMDKVRFLILEEKLGGTHRIGDHRLPTELKPFGRVLDALYRAESEASA